MGTGAVGDSEAELEEVYVEGARFDGIGPLYVQTAKIVTRKPLKAGKYNIIELEQEDAAANEAVL